MESRIYVGCSLSHATSEYNDEIILLKQILKEHFKSEILEFVGTVKGTVQDVYEHDIHRCVEECDIFVVECSYPSTGLGWEMGKAVELLRKPVFAFAKRGLKVSRLVIGAECARNPLYSFMEYDDISEIPQMVENLMHNKLMKLA